MRSESSALEKNLNILIRLLTEKQTLLNHLTKEYNKQKGIFEELQASFNTLDNEFEFQINKKKKERCSNEATHP